LRLNACKQFIEQLLLSTSSLNDWFPEVRTFLNCHKLFLNTVSISLRAKIKSAHDLHIGIARFVLAGFLERGATRLWHSFCSILPALPLWGSFSFFLQKKKQTGTWSTLLWLERHQASGTSLFSTRERRKVNNCVIVRKGLLLGITNEIIRPLGHSLVTLP
jgi:hypothetical protein